MLLTYYFRSTLSLVATGLALAGGAAHAATYCVNPAGSSGCMKTITAAVSAASGSDVVMVGPGTYKESVTVSKPISLIGAAADTVIIDATGLGVGIYVNGLDNSGLANVFVSGFTVQNANFEGILINNASNVVVSSNVVQNNNLGLTPGASGLSCPNIPAYDTNEGDDCGEGIHLNGAVHSMVLNNVVQNNAGGILISDDTGANHDNLIAGNVVQNNVFDCGITLASHIPAKSAGSSAPLGVYNNAVVGNTSTGNGVKGEGAGAGIFASVPGAQAYGNSVINNLLTANGQPGVSMHSHTPNQKLTGNIVIGNTISGNAADAGDAATPSTAGINVYGVSSINGTIIAQNTISKEGVDVAVKGPGLVTVVRNNLLSGTGVANLGSGSVNADGNWWGCNNNPTFPISGFAGCSSTSGAVTVNVFAASPILH